MFSVLILSLLQRAALKNFSASDSDESPRIATFQAGGAVSKVQAGANARKQAADDDEFDLPGL